MIILIVSFVIGQLLVVTNARPAPQDLRKSQFDAFGPIDNAFDPFLNSAMDAEIPDLRQNQFDAFGPIDDTFDPYNVNDVILPNFFPRTRSVNEYFDSSSSFDIYNDLVYGSDFLTNHAPFFPGIGNRFGPMFPFAADISFDRFQFRPVVDFAKSLEDIDSYFGDESRDLLDYFGGTFDSRGDAGEFDSLLEGSLGSFFSQLYDVKGPLFNAEDIPLA